jgi:ankyrin repeat protein
MGRQGAGGVFARVSGCRGGVQGGGRAEPELLPSSSCSRDNDLEKVVRALLKAGAKPNKQGGQHSWYALYAVPQNNFSRIACIINLGNYEGVTPMYVACAKNSLSVVKLLVRARGINMNHCEEDD